MLTIRIAPDGTTGSNGEDIADGRESNVAKKSSEFLLLSRHADVVPDPIPPGHRWPRLVRVQFPWVEVEENRLALASIHSPDSGSSQCHR